MPVTHLGRWRGQAPWLLWGASFLTTMVGLQLFVANGTAREQPLQPAVAVAMGLAYPWIGAVLSSAGSSKRLGWLYSLGGLVGLSFFLEQYATYTLIHSARAPGAVWAAWAGTWLWAPGSLSVVTLALLLFPDGRPPSSRWRPVVVGVMGWIAATTVLAALAPGVLASYPAGNPVGVGWLPPDVSSAMAAVCVLLLAPLCLGAVLARCRHSVGQGRAQLRWFAGAAAVTVLTPFLGILVPLGLPLAAFQALGALSVLALPFGVAVAIARLRLFDLGISDTTRLIDRSVVSVAVVCLLLPTYGLAVLVLDVPTLAAAVAALAVYPPLRRQIRNVVERTRSASRAHFALLELGRRLEKTVAPDRVLPESVESLAEALDLSYVAIEVRDVDGGTLAAEVRGDVRADAEVFPLMHQGQVVGRLAVASSNGDGRLVSDDRQLLHRLCGQLGVAAYGVRQTAALQRTKERLVTVHEEEKARVRRAHHDGIKPALSGVICELDAVLNMCGDSEDGQAGLLRRVARQVASAKAMVGSVTTDIRRLGEDRGPLQLDELGLVGALRHHVARFALPPTDLILNVHAPDDLKGLPTEMEVSVFLLVCEAVENVRKHARASRCDVVLALEDGFLHVEVRDNGVGLEPGHQQGVGMSSMEARVEELEGDFAVHSSPGHGVRLCADLPLPRRAAAQE